MLIIALLLAFISCQDKSTKEAVSSEPQVGFAYPVALTIEKIGDQKHAKTLLDIWKASDDRDMAKLKLLIADSFEYHTAEGLWPSTNRDSLFRVAEAGDSNLVSVRSAVTTVIPFSLKNSITGQNEDWVTIWGTRVIKYKNGKKDSMWIHENWKMNDEGKGEVLYQFASIAERMKDK